MSESLLDNEYKREKFTLANPKPWQILSELKGENFKEYRRLIRTAENCEILTRLPVEIFIKTTLTCNHKCSKCLHGLNIFPSGKKYNMSFDTLKKVLDESSDKGVRSVVFTGGEPTIHPQFIKFIEYASSLDFDDISIVTNGSNLTDEIIRCIVSNKVTRINVSLDAFTRETYKLVHGIDDFQNVVSGLKRLCKEIEQLPLLSISIVLSDETKSELEDFCKEYEKIATGGIKIYPYKDVFSIVDEEFYETYGHGKSSIAEITEQQMHKLSKDFEIVKNYSIKCTSPWYRCHIGINGEVQACTTQGFCDHPSMTMGNIHEQSFEEIWKSPQWEQLREIVKNKDFNKHPVCKICQMSVQ